MDNTSLELDHIRLFSFQLLRAVNFIHSAHIIHRDIQMSNVFINVDTLMLKVNYYFLGHGNSWSMTHWRISRLVISDRHEFWIIVNRIVFYHFLVTYGGITHQKSFSENEIMILQLIYFLLVLYFMQCVMVLLMILVTQAPISLNSGLIESAQCHPVVTMILTIS